MHARERPHRRRVREMLLHVGPGSEYALLLAAPERDPDGPVHFQTQGLQDPYNLKHHSAAGAVVGSSCPGVPGIQMRADHDDFVGFRGAWNLPDYVRGIHIRLGNRRLDVQLETNRRFHFDCARDAVVLFGGDHELGRSERVGGAKTSGGLCRKRAAAGAIVL